MSAADRSAVDGSAVPDKSRHLVVMVHGSGWRFYGCVIHVVLLATFHITIPKLLGTKLAQWILQGWTAMEYFNAQNFPQESPRILCKQRMTCGSLSRTHLAVPLSEFVPSKQGRF